MSTLSVQTITDVRSFDFASGFVDSNFSSTSYCRDNNDDGIGSWAGGINSEALSASYKRLRTTSTITVMEIAQ